MKMKIKITEDQAKRLKLINENLDPLSQFEQHCSKLVIEVNKIYSQLINVTIGEILSKEVDMEIINNVLDTIDHSLNIGNRKAYGYIENLSQEGLDIRIDKANDSVSDRLTPLQLIVMDLEKLQLSIEEHNLNEPFKDIKPIDITNNQI